METFREELSKAVDDPFSVVIKQSPRKEYKYITFVTNFSCWK
ncbi:MAG: hypothetical protein CBC16_03585, partial [Verrucomicrobia bacterium TMED56]